MNCLSKIDISLQFLRLMFVLFLMFRSPSLHYNFAFQNYFKINDSLIQIIPVHRNSIIILMMIIFYAYLKGWESLILRTYGYKLMIDGYLTNHWAQL